MKIAVLTLTRDRLWYTKHCFASLREFAGCEYDHLIFDQGSSDGTWEWLTEEYDWAYGGMAHREDENVGIGRGLNWLLGVFDEGADYDVVVKFDNDCDLTQPNTLRDIAQLVVEGGCILSPRILGLKNPPQTIRTSLIGQERILEVPHVGGIFLAVQAGVFNEFRYSEHSPTWGGDDSEICQWFRSQGGTCGYVERLEAWHYETTEGQIARYPEYHERKLRELTEIGWVTA